MLVISKFWTDEYVVYLMWGATCQDQKRLFVAHFTFTYYEVPGKVKFSLRFMILFMGRGVTWSARWGNHPTPIPSSGLVRKDLSHPLLPRFLPRLARKGTRCIGGRSTTCFQGFWSTALIGTKSHEKNLTVRFDNITCDRWPGQLRKDFDRHLLV